MNYNQLGNGFIVNNGIITDLYGWTLSWDDAIRKVIEIPRLKLSFNNAPYEEIKCPISESLTI